jgi:spermidine synthase
MMGWAWATTAWAWATTAWAWAIKSAVRTRLHIIRHLSSPSIRGAVVRPLGIVFCAGVNLILMQWVLVRELTTLLLGTEIIILLVSALYFTGLSLGYLLARRIKSFMAGWFVSMAILTLALHLSLPIWFRLLVALFAEDGNHGISFIILPLLTPFVVPLFYSLFLPVFVENTHLGLPALYATELLGAGVGVVSLVAQGSSGVLPLLLLYVVILLAIIWQLGVPRPAIIILAGASVAWLAVFQPLNLWSNDRWYAAVHHLPQDARTTFTGYSPYQKVDVLEITPDQRLLYLDGLLHYGDTQSSRLNTFLGYIPAALIQPELALVIGAGSMEMEQQISQYAGHVRTVEIDPMVVDVSLRYFDHVNLMSRLSNRSVVVDDAKHYLATTEETYDLVATDTPAAHALQTTTLYSAQFYDSIATRLNSHGVLAANLTSRFTPSDDVSRRIAAALLTAFEQIIVVTPRSAEWSFAYVGSPLPFDSQQLAAALRASGEVEFVIFDTSAVRAIVGNAAPITLDALDVALSVSLDRIIGRMSR